MIGLTTKFPKPIKYAYYAISAMFLLYLLIPSPEFPAPPPDAQQSKEPGDVLDLDSRRAYFTDQTREQIRSHYQSQFQHSGILSMIPPITLQNYPFEEAEWHVYTPLKASYLEQLIYPFRESFFISFYEPGPDDDAIAFEGKPYAIKITVRYYHSSIIARLIVASMTLIMIPIITSYLWEQLRLLFKRPHSTQKNKTKTNSKKK